MEKQQPADIVGDDQTLRPQSKKQKSSDDDDTASTLSTITQASEAPQLALGAFPVRRSTNQLPTTWNPRGRPGAAPALGTQPAFDRLGMAPRAWNQDLPPLTSSSVDQTTGTVYSGPTARGQFPQPARKSALGTAPREWDAGLSTPALGSTYGMTTTKESNAMDTDSASHHSGAMVSMSGSSIDSKSTLSGGTVRSGQSTASRMTNASSQSGLSGYSSGSAMTGLKSFPSSTGSMSTTPSFSSAPAPVPIQPAFVDKGPSRVSTSNMPAPQPVVRAKVVPKTALHSYFGQAPRRKVLSPADYITWHDGGPPHNLHWSSVFISPETGEAFASGCHGDPKSYQTVTLQPISPGDEPEVIVWYNKKSFAEHGAAARAYDCLTFREPPSGKTYHRIGDNEPYYEPRPLPSNMTEAARTQAMAKQEKIYGSLETK